MGINVYNAPLHYVENLKEMLKYALVLLNQVFLAHQHALLDIIILKA